jgi:hypothetical protein
MHRSHFHIYLCDNYCARMHRFHFHLCLCEIHCIEPHLDAARAEVGGKRERLLRSELPREQLVRGAKVEEQVLAEAAVLFGGEIR